MNNPSLQEPGSLNSPKQIVLIVALAAIYLLLSYVLIGFKIDQVYLVLLVAVFYFSSRITRKFITGFSIFILFWIIFDFMKAFPNYHFNTVHIESLYRAEKKLFGISVESKILTPNEYWLTHHNTWLDLMAGVFYLCWVPVPLAFAVYLFFQNRVAFLHFSLTFFLVNLIGFAIYYIYPAAPPWYVQQHGFDFLPFTKGNTAGLERFDVYFNTSVFHSLYSKSSNVFAAMPSLHSSYPVIVLYYAVKNKIGTVNILLAFVMIGIWFSAVYTSHHYVLDVIAGITCALTAICLFQWMVLHHSGAKKIILKFAKHIE